MALRDLYAAVWEKADGPAWAARHGMTSAAYQQTFDQFMQQGFRLRGVTGCGVNGRDFYTAVWDKTGGPAWAARHGMSSAAYQQAFDGFMHEGYRLRCVSGYAVNNQDFYAAIWDKADGPAWGARHGMDSAAYQQAFDQFTRQGFRPRWVSTYALNGRDLYAAIWEKSAGPAWEAHHGMTEDAFQAKSVGLAGLGFRLRCVSACPVGEGDLYAAVWEKTTGPVPVAHHAMTSDTYQVLFDQLVGQGFRPSVVSSYTGNQPVDAVLRFTMERQQQGNWCWAATSVSVAKFYDPSSTWTQCAMANGQLSRNDCCGGGASGACNVYGFLDGSLQRAGHLDHVTGGTTSYGIVHEQMLAGRPLGIRVAWAGGGAHFVAATGIEEGEMVVVSDCGSGTTSVVAYDTLSAAYNGSGTWTDSYFTKP